MPVASSRAPPSQTRTDQARTGQATPRGGILKFASGKGHRQIRREKGRERERERETTDKPTSQSLHVARQFHNFQASFVERVCGHNVGVYASASSF